MSNEATEGTDMTWNSPTPPQWQNEHRRQAPPLEVNIEHAEPIDIDSWARAWVRSIIEDERNRASVA